MGLFNKRGDRELIPIGWALALVLGVALGVIGGLLWLALTHLGAPAFTREQVGLTAYLDIVKIALAVVAGLGGVVALVVAYRRQRTDEQAERREHARLENERTRLLNERFNTASEQLGSDKPAVRLAGVHAMANLADDWDDHEARQMCIDVLCSYLRMSATFPDIRAAFLYPETAEQARINGETAIGREYHGETRHTILRTIAAHLRKDGTTVSWIGHDFDLRGITIDLDLDFTGAEFATGTVNLSDTEFTIGHIKFDDAHFSGGQVRFSGAQFSRAQLAFIGARFSGGQVQFDGARFTGGEVRFDRSQFSGGQVWFKNAKFAGGEVVFYEAEFCGSDVIFDSAQFSGCHFLFDDAQFSGGQVGFDDAQFSMGQVRFDRPQFFGGQVWFTYARFAGGQVWFTYAKFTGGQVRFDAATLSNEELHFDCVKVHSGTVSFDGADFSGARWTSPKSAWQVPPTGLPDSATGLIPPRS